MCSYSDINVLAFSHNEEHRREASYFFVNYFIYLHPNILNPLFPLSEFFLLGNSFDHLPGPSLRCQVDTQLPSPGKSKQAGGIVLKRLLFCSWGLPFQQANILNPRNKTWLVIMN